MGVISVPARKVSQEMAKHAQVIFLTQYAAMMVFVLHCKVTIGTKAIVKPNLACRQSQSRPWKLTQ